MRWGRRFPTARPPRPKVRRVAVDEREQVLAELNKAVQRSPVLQAFRVEAHALRGRFYLHWHWEPADEASSEVCGRGSRHSRNRRTISCWRSNTARGGGPWLRAPFADS